MEDRRRMMASRIVNGSINFIFLNTIPRQRRVALRIVARGINFISSQLKPRHQSRSLDRVIMGAVNIFSRQFVLWSTGILRITEAGVVELHLAESVGFEPTVPVKGHLVSSEALSTTQPTLLMTYKLAYFLP